jgi:hypothetical protein
MKTVKRFPDKSEMEGRRMDKAIKKFPGSKLRISKKGVEFVLPIRIREESVKIVSFGEEAAVAIEQALWLRDKFENLRKAQAGQ